MSREVPRFLDTPRDSMPYLFQPVQVRVIYRLLFSCSNAKDVLQPQLYGAAQAHLAVQRGIDGLDQRLAVAVERTAEGKVV